MSGHDCSATAANYAGSPRCPNKGSVIWVDGVLRYLCDRHRAQYAFAPKQSAFTWGWTRSKPEWQVV